MEITDSFTHINVDSGQLVDRDRILSPGEETVREREEKRHGCRSGSRVESEGISRVGKKTFNSFKDLDQSTSTVQYSKLICIYNSAKNNLVV